MPRYNQHYFTCNGELYLKYLYTMYKPNLNSIAPENTFALIPIHERAVRLPFICSRVERAADKDVIFSKGRANNTMILNTYVYNGVDAFMEESSYSVGNFPKLRRVDLIGHYIINYIRRAIEVYDLCTGDVQTLMEGRFVKKKKMFRVTVLFVEGCFKVLIFTGETFQFVEVPIPDDGYFVEIINSFHPSFYYFSSESLHKVTIMYGRVDVQEIDVKFGFEEDKNIPNQVFLMDDLHFFVFIKLGEIKAYKIGESGTECLVNMSIYQFHKFIYLDNTLFGMFDDKLIPFTIEYCVGGYCIPRNSFLSKSVSNHIHFPFFVSAQFVVSFVMFGTQNPSVVIHGSTGEGTKDLFATKAYVYEDIVPTQIFRKDKAFCANVSGNQSDEIEIDCNEENIEYVAGRFVHIDDGKLYIDGVYGYEVPVNDWFEIFPSKDVVWICGTSCIGIILMEKDQVQFDFIHIDDDVYPRVLPSQYNPLMGICEFCGKKEIITYIEGSFKTFSFFQTRTYDEIEFFIDENIFIASNRIFRFTNEVIESIDLELPWSFVKNPNYTFTSTERGTITRLHKQMDGYDIVKEILTFDDDYGSFKVCPVRHSLIELLIHSQFHHVSKVGSGVRRDAVLCFFDCQ
ncbi:hypothetical protein PCE1_001678 [Barthelona sp. PCE]